APRQLNELQSGMYRDGVKEFIIVDCRFDYEYEGGHIDGAINLSELADVEARLLNSANPPQPSTSDCAPAEGKTVLIFHCEFSAKRAPTSAKHLRNQDRQKNFAAYPNIFYPELYILQGGYEAYYKAYPVSPPHTCSAPLAGQDG
ncbi:Rhodanese-like domain-containing protein, partial [Rhodotorula diobovata]